MRPLVAVRRIRHRLQRQRRLASGMRTMRKPCRRRRLGPRGIADRRSGANQSFRAGGREPSVETSPKIRATRIAHGSPGARLPSPRRLLVAATDPRRLLSSLAASTQSLGRIGVLLICLTISSMSAPAQPGPPTPPRPALRLRPLVRGDGLEASRHLLRAMTHHVAESAFASQAQPVKART